MKELESFYRKNRLGFEDKLKDYLKNNLKQFGFEFTADADFISFCKERVSRIAFSEPKKYYEFYLDYIDLNNTGKMIGCYSENVEYKNEGSKITVQIEYSLGLKTNHF